MKARTVPRAYCVYTQPRLPVLVLCFWRVVSTPSRLPRDTAILDLSQAQASKCLLSARFSVPFLSY